MVKEKKVKPRRGGGVKSKGNDVIWVGRGLGKKPAYVLTLSHEGSSVNTGRNFHGSGRHPKTIVLKPSKELPGEAVEGLKVQWVSTLKGSSVLAACPGGWKGHTNPGNNGANCKVKKGKQPPCRGGIEQQHRGKGERVKGGRSSPTQQGLEYNQQGSLFEGVGKGPNGHRRRIKPRGKKEDGKKLQLERPEARGALGLGG